MNYSRKDSCVQYLILWCRYGRNATDSIVSSASTPDYIIVRIPLNVLKKYSRNASSRLHIILTVQSLTHKKENMKDPAFANAYEEIQPEMNVIRAIIEAGTSQNLTQTPGRKNGITHSEISCLENNTRNPSITISTM